MRDGSNSRLDWLALGPEPVDEAIADVKLAKYSAGSTSCILRARKSPSRSRRPGFEAIYIGADHPQGEGGREECQNRLGLR